MTLKEIAAELGVSPSTVSRVVNGYSKNFSVVPEVREKILEKVRVSGYRANPVFSTIRSRRNRRPFRQPRRLRRLRQSRKKPRRITQTAVLP